MNNREELISIQERKDMPYLEMGRDIKFKVVDMDKAIQNLRKSRKKEGQTDIIELKVIKADRYKEISRGPTWVKDHITGIYYGIVYGLYPDGNLKFQRIQLSDVNTFDLANDTEAKFWMVMRMHPIVKGSPFEREALFHVVDQEMEAKKTLNRARLVQLNINRAMAMRKDKVLRFARYAGVPVPADPTLRIVRSMITTMAFETPERFQELYESKIRAIAEAFHSGRQLGIIIEHMDKGYSFEGILLGTTDAEAYRFLEGDTVTLTRIEKAIAAIDQGLVDDEEKEEVKEEALKED